MKYIFSALAASLLLFSGCKNMGTEAVDLHFNLQPGTQYQYVIESKQTIDIEMMGTPIKTNQDMMMAATYKVEAADGNNKKLTVNYDRITMKSATPGGEAEYDSQDPAKQDSLFSSIGRMINVPFSMVINPQGDIVSVAGVQQAVGQGMDSNMQAMMQSQFSDSNIRSMMQQSLNVYPDRPVKVGDEWQRSFSMAVGFMNMNINNTYKLLSVENGIAHIDIKAQITTKPGGASGLEMQLTGVQTGTMDIEVATGLIVDSKIKQQLSGQMNNSGIQVPMTSDADIHTTGKKK